MATEVPRSVGTNGGLRDYTSLSSCESDNQRNIVAADEIEIWSCYDDAVMFNSITIDGWTTDSTRYIKITTPLSERHHGMPYTGFRLDGGASATVINIADGNVWIDGLSIKTTGSWAIYFVVTANPGWGRASNNLLEGSIYYTHTGGGASPLLFYIWNNFILPNGTGILCSESISLNYIYNNSIYGGTTGMRPVYADKTIAKNNVVAGTSSFDFRDSADFHADSEYNASEDTAVSGAGAPGANSIYEISAINQYTSIDPGNENLQVKDTAADIYQAGTDLSADGDLAFDDDFYEESRSAPWDMGADAFSLSPPAPPAAAAESLHTVGTDGGLRDYTSLSSCESDNQRNLTTDNSGEGAIDVWACYDDAVMSNTVIIDGWITNTRCYIKIYTLAAQRHDGTIGTGFRLDGGAGIPIRSNDGNVWIDGLSIKTTGSWAIYFAVTANPGWCKASNNLIEGSIYYTHTGDGASPLLFYIWNNFILPNLTKTGILCSESISLNYVYNNSIYGGKTGIHPVYANKTIIKNTVALGTSQSDFKDSSDSHADSEYNASEDTAVSGAGAPGANSLYEITGANNFKDLTGGAEDLHGKDTGADIYQTGVDLSADGNLSFSDDIDGDVRGLLWDIGADDAFEEVAAVAAANSIMHIIAMMSGGR